MQRSFPCFANAGPLQRIQAAAADCTGCRRRGLQVRTDRLHAREQWQPVGIFQNGDLLAGRSGPDSRPTPRPV